MHVSPVPNPQSKHHSKRGAEPNGPDRDSSERSRPPVQKFAKRNVTLAQQSDHCHQVDESVEEEYVWPRLHHRNPFPDNPILCDKYARGASPFRRSDRPGRGRLDGCRVSYTVRGKPLERRWHQHRGRHEYGEGNQEPPDESSAGPGLARYDGPFGSGLGSVLGHSGSKQFAGDGVHQTELQCQHRECDKEEHDPRGVAPAGTLGVPVVLVPRLNAKQDATAQHILGTAVRQDYPHGGAHSEGDVCGAHCQIDLPPSLPRLGPRVSAEMEQLEREHDQQSDRSWNQDDEADEPCELRRGVRRSQSVPGIRMKHRGCVPSRQPNQGEEKAKRAEGKHPRQFLQQKRRWSREIGERALGPRWISACPGSIGEQLPRVALVHRQVRVVRRSIVKRLGRHLHRLQYSIPVGVSHAVCAPGGWAGVERAQVVRRWVVAPPEPSNARVTPVPFTPSPLVTVGGSRRNQQFMTADPDWESS
eukprot:m.414676 g.414676  ORF g.414676 m.414676 type:complete len:474 (+) comp29402_c0_seq1:4977-6398(+)